MKKLLSLLSVLTISGTAVPTTIAASPYQKEETIKNSDINYQQTNNLESLNRSKREHQYYYQQPYNNGYGYQQYLPHTIEQRGVSTVIKKIAQKFFYGIVDGVGQEVGKKVGEQILNNNQCN